MDSDKNEAPKLPDGWVLCTSKSNPGRKYYFNKKTGKSSWTVPEAQESNECKQKNNRKAKPNQEKFKKEEIVKKHLKRKSDFINEPGPAKKKQKDETKTPEKPNTSSKIHQKNYPASAKKYHPPNKKHTPRKFSLDSADKRSSNKSSKKNLANARLSQLRNQLNLEAQNELNERTPVKRNSSPKPQTETQAKISKPEHSSPTAQNNEFKFATQSQSPSSDSLQSAPSPSQFLAANKIISSMKAQLPEEFCDKAKPKDTFADIEEGISKQMPEYPFMKHPATPPQFSEATKLVSAIKSKLAYKVSPKEGDCKAINTAKDRMQALRASLGNDLVETNTELLNNTLDTSEAMDIDCKEIKDSDPIAISPCKGIGGDYKENVVLVVDTNIFIHELDFIKNVLNCNIKGYKEQPTLLVPWRVINELDRLKDNNNGNGAICKRARSAMDYLYKSLPENSRIKGQSLRDSNSHIYPCEVPDDEILNCCLQQADRGKSVILLSNDKNLCNKATINNVKSIGLAEMKTLLEHRAPSEPEPDLTATVAHYTHTMYQLLANILENEMRAKYNNLWQHVLFKVPPWSLADVLQCLLKHWIAVFNEVFPRIEHLIADLKNSLISIESKDPKALSRSEVLNFMELCMDVAKKCQIIPEYMSLAKSTVEKLAAGPGAAPPDERPVIEGFEAVWTVFSSYCSKLATSLGVAHGVEDRLSAVEAGGAGDAGGPPRARLPRLHALSADLATAIRGVTESESGQTEGAGSEARARLLAALQASLALAGRPAALAPRDLAAFCANCRNMLQEAYTKFTQLNELLDVCKNCISDQ